MRLIVFFQKFKPGVNRRAHLILSALLWTVVGVILMCRGGVWLSLEKKFYYIIPAIFVGTVKTLFVLDKSAKKSIERILKLADGSCLGAVYSIKTWMLIISMICLGFIIRGLNIPREIIGGLYITIGWALFFASRSAWFAAKKFKS